MRLKSKDGDKNTIRELEEQEDIRIHTKDCRGIGYSTRQTLNKSYQGRDFHDLMINSKAKQTQRKVL